MIPDEWKKFAPPLNDLAPDQNWHVFLSYRSVNRGWVLSLYDVLTELGYKVFLDQYVLKVADLLVQVLQENLASSQAGILIWSNAAQDSAWVKNEYFTMITRATNDPSFRFAPIKIDRIPLPPFVNIRLFADFTDYPDGPNGGDLLRLLYGISKQNIGGEAVRFAYEQDEAAGIINAKISAAIRNGKAQKLIDFYNEGGLPWLTTASLGCKAAEGLIKLGKEDDAISILTKLEKQFPKSIRPKQLKALALARRGTGGDLDDAQDIIGELYELNHLDPETLGIYGRTWMDRYKKSNNPSDLRISRNYYADAFSRAPDDYYTGINAASKSIFLGENDKAREFTDAVEKLVGQTAIDGDYWKTATVAEVMLIKGKFSEAASMYQKAVDMAATEIKSHESTRDQAKLLLEKMGVNSDMVSQVLKPFKHLT